MDERERYREGHAQAEECQQTGIVPSNKYLFLDFLQHNKAFDHEASKTNEFIQKFT